MARLGLGSIALCGVLYTMLIVGIEGQPDFQGSYYFPNYGWPIRPPLKGKGKADGPHIGGRPNIGHHGTGTGVYPQFPPPEPPVARPRPRPRPRPVTPRPIPPTKRPTPQPPKPTEPIYPIAPVVPIKPVVPARPNPVPTGVAGVPHHTIPPAPTVEFQNIPMGTRRPYWPRQRPRYTEPPLPCTIFQRNPCSNRGICNLDHISRKSYCECRDLYAGDQCELVLKPPKNLTMVNVASTFVSVSWLPPPVETRAITGFVVQYNKFGATQSLFSPHIHPGVTDYTVRDLEPESQYTICINIVFKNITVRDAILRDQCLEIRTQPDEFKTDGISMTFMALIVGAVVLVLVCIMVIALLIQRRCLKPIQPIQAIQRAMSRRSMLIPRHQLHKQNVNHHNHHPRQQQAAAASSARDCSDQEAEACVKMQRIPLSNQRHQANPFFARLQTNNGNNSDYKDWALPVSVNYSRLNMPDQPPKYTRSSSQSKGHAPNSSSSTSRERTELSTFGHQMTKPQDMRPDLRNSRSVPTHATIRALPPSVSNHVMRSKNAREKDASNEFDVRGSYMYFSGHNMTA